jgi:hypothetical protein
MFANLCRQNKHKGNNILQLSHLKANGNYK